MSFIGSSSSKRRRNSIDNASCAKKLIIRLALPLEKITKQHVIMVNHIFDAESGQKFPLLNPYLIILKQGLSRQLFGLQYLADVNGEATEEVINKRRRSFIGCDDISNDPTCGNVYKNGKFVNFSQGFCCSCDEKINRERENKVSIQNSVNKLNSEKNKIDSLDKEFSVNIMNDNIVEGM